MIKTKGDLEVVSVSGDTLTLEGWAATQGAGRVDDFHVSLRGRNLAPIQREYGRPSPEVQAKYPELDHSNACRYRLRYRLDPAHAREFETGVLAVTPMVAGRKGKLHIHLNKSALPTPSAEDIVTIGNGFLEVSENYLRHFIQLADLKATDHVLDVGCGVGRMAYMLAHYLRPEARYEGFDILGHLVDWASANISPTYPNFRFQKVDVYNKHYNPRGRILPRKFRFPYKDESFDFIFLTSVFTHMLGPELRHYLDEFRRVLKPGGRCLTTCFLLNDESRKLIQEKKATYELIHPAGEGFTNEPSDPEAAIGFDEKDIASWLADRGFVIEGTHYGQWSGRSDFTCFQDILVYRKVGLPRGPRAALSSVVRAFREGLGL